MKNLKDFILEQDLKKASTPEHIAKKHNISIDTINTQLDMGIKVEKEHTKSKELARKIALQHLDEFPDYYTRLKKAEA
jgi:hypothetical protein